MRSAHSRFAIPNILLALSAILLLALSASAAPPIASQSNPIIVGYVFPQNRLLAPAEIPAAKLTRINYAFANIQDGRIVNGFAHDDENLATLVALRSQYPHLTILVSVGGWLWSGSFSQMALTQPSRATFIESVAEYIQQHALDGLDIDWEYPGMAGATTNFRPEDRENYTILLAELRHRFRTLQAQLHRPLYLTVATGSGDDFLAHTEMNKVARIVDTVNLMAYDYYEAGDTGMTGHHAPLEPSPLDPHGFSAHRSVQAYLKAGVPPAKIVLGVPFYHHIWGQVPATNHGLYQPGQPLAKSAPELGQSPQTLLQNGFVRYWDPQARAPYLYHPDKQIFVSYDDPESLALKGSFVRSEHLGGIMFWELSSDTTGQLLDSVYQALHPGHPD